MKTVLAFLLALVASSSYAAAVPLTPGPGVAGTASGFTTAANFTGQFSAASFNNTFSTNVGGKMVTMPATMRMAANAGQFAVSAVRLNPAALVGGAVAAWLLGYGIEWLEGQWQKSSVGDPVGTCNGNGVGNSASFGFPATGLSNSSCLAKVKSSLQANFSGSTYTYKSTSGGTYNWGVYHPCCGSWDVEAGSWAQTAPGQTVRNPATDTDWAAIPQNAPLPDPVAGELASKGVPLPLEVPHIAPQDIPLSDPYVDPVTGKRYRDQARITPSSDGKTADVQTYKQEVDEAGNPKKDEDGQTDKPPEEQTDFCKKNPDAIACMPEGQTDDQELQTKNIGSGITPISVGGQGQCMADKTLSMATMGKSITFTYKPICDLASMVRPLILALAWLLAGWIMVGAVKDN